ncbi:MAG: GspH/FimT family pseudopilin [Francisella sp.]
MIKKKGFSLIEVMIVVAIMSILMMAAISSFTFYYKTFAETRLVNLQKLIEYSVVKARIDNKTVVVCAATPDSFDAEGRLNEKSFACANSSSWADSPIVAFESDDGTNIYNINDKIIANISQGHGEHIYIKLEGNSTYIKINPNGFLATGNGSIVYCDKANKYQAALIMTLVGRVKYTDSPTNINGITYACQ